MILLDNIVFASSLVGVIQAVCFLFYVCCSFLHTFATRVLFFFVECNFTCLMCVCDKCNDFVFHYLLDYSCRALLVDSVLFLILEKTVDFIQCMCVENSFALVSFAKVGANQVQHFVVVLLLF